MNKSDLIDAIAKSADISKAAAGRALDATMDVVKKALKKGIARKSLAAAVFNP